jgi:hypothetical protein
VLVAFATLNEGACVPWHLPITQELLFQVMAGVNFTNIVRAAFAPIFLRQKNLNLKFKYKKVSR